MRPARVALLLALLAPASAGAQVGAPPTGYAFSSWGTGQGLPQNNIEGIAEDRDGYLWIGTTGRLVRFDGRRFVEAPLADASRRGLDPLRSLVTDRHGDVWVLRYPAPAARVGRNGRVEDTLSLPRAPRDMAFGPGDSVWITGDDELWLHTAGRWTHETAADDAVHSVQALLVDSTGAAWIGGTDGLARVARGKVTGWKLGRGLPGRAVIALASGPDGVWVGTDGGLVHVAPGGEPRPVAIDSGGRASVHAIAVAGPDRLWIAGRDGVRLLAVTTDARGVVSARTVFSHPAALGGTTVTVLHLDDAGRLWIGTQGAGLHQLRPLAIARLRTRDGLPSRTVHEVLGDGTDGLWIAGGCTGLIRWRAGRTGTFRPPAMGLRHVCVEGLGRDRHGTLWIGQRAHLTRLDPTGAVQQYELPGPAYAIPGPGSQVVVGPLFPDRRGRVWLATSLGDVGRIDENGTLAFPLDVAGLQRERVWSFAEDSAGAVWVGQVGAVSRIESDRVTTRIDTLDGIPPGAIRALLPEPDGGLWVASYGGGLAHVEGGRTMHRLTTRNGLFDDALSAIVRDSANRLWLLGDAGLAVVPRTALLDAIRERRPPREAVVFGPQDSMPEGNGGFPNAWLDVNQRLWLATVDGVASVDAGAFPFDRTPIRPRLDEVRLDGHAVPPGSVTVPPGEHTLEITFSAPNLDATDRLRFRYRLVGHDPDWVESGSERVARYARLAPRTYRFELRGRNVDGIEGTTVISLDVLVQAAWWQQWWVRALGGLLLALAVARWHVWRMARVDARNRLLQAEIDERKRAQSEASRAASELAHVSRLATAGELATSLAHELNQPLTAVMSNAQAARQMHKLGIDDEMEPVLDDVVAQAERAAGVVRAMRAFVRKQEPTSAAVDPAQLVDETLRLLHSELTARGVTARTEQTGEPASMRGDRVQLQQVLVNLLLNAADAVRDLAPERRALLVRWGKDGGGNVELCVKDRGHGLTPEQLRRSLEPFYTTKPTGLGMGLPLSRSIVEAHGGALALDSVPGEGTVARIRVPVWREP